MRSITVIRTMRADREAVWSVLDDFGNISVWNGGVKASHSTSDEPTGLGATRHCDLAPAGQLEETIVGYTPTSQMVVRIDSAKTLPIDHGQATFDLGDSTPLEMSLRYDYQPKGLVGRLMGPMLDRQLTRGFNGFLADLDAAAG